MKGALRHLSVALCALFLSVGTALACVEDQATLDRNASPQNGTWYAFDSSLGTLPGSFGPSGSCSGKTFAEAETCAKAAVDAALYGHSGYVCAETPWPSTFTTSGTERMWTKNCGAQGNRWVKVKQSSTSYPAGYTHELCPEAVCEGTPGEVRAVELPDASYPATTCVNNCVWERQPLTICLSGGCTSRYVNSGTTCETPSGPEGTPTDNDNELDNCVASSGHTFCHRDDTTNCGTVNGDYVCLPSSPGTCQAGSAGGKFCESSAATPPKPDTGVPGVPATPEVNVTTNVYEGSSSSYSSTSYNYYNPGTVAGSSNQTPAEGGDPLCDPDVDANCGRTGEEWVDREYTPPGMPGFPENPYAAYDPESAWGSAFQTEGQSQASGFVTSLSGTFPFSLAFSGPLSMFETGSAVPQFSYTAAGHTASASMSMWNDLFALVRIAAGVLLLFGAWLVFMATISTWAK